MLDRAADRFDVYCFPNCSGAFSDAIITYKKGIEWIDNDTNPEIKPLIRLERDGAFNLLILEN